MDCGLLWVMVAEPILPWSYLTPTSAIIIISHISIVIIVVIVLLCVSLSSLPLLLSL